MRLDPGAWLALASALGPDYERGALDCAGGRLEGVAAVLSALDWPASAEVHPWGLEAGGLWGPWREARETVERLPGEAQERGAQADYIAYDRAEGSLVFGRIGPWRTACPRFAARECPRMAPMGHESPQSECNYWAWPGMAEAAPGVELFPEWQRFDCSRHYPLFQLHLCGEALAQRLGARPRWVLHAPPEALGALRSYAALTRRPEAFALGPFPGL